MRFACQTGCTKCCRIRGWVYLTEVDLHQAAAYLNLTPAEFELQHAIRYRHVFRLRKLPRGQDQCRFLTATGCSIHPVKPTQCRTYPFWPSLVESRSRWSLEAKTCPGINQGELVQINTAREIANELPRSFPTLGCF
jgi:uncharacterized protein